MSVISRARFGVVVPVKPLAVGKSRLRALDDGVRRELVAAFALDTTAAALSAEMVETVLVVTDDHAFARVLEDRGCEVVPDGIGGDLNGSLRLAAAELLRRRPGLAVAALCADLPSMRPDELDAALREVSPALAAGRPAFVPDAAGTGTVLLAASGLDDFRPRFGPGSRAAHLADGAAEIAIDAQGLRHDVDTPEDLASALARGVGESTHSVAVAGLGAR